ncbi:uncharacterized protein LOC101892051 [Musca domestica]|uniref:Uncharacterized protein LOC101892051 n=1 Tax=Musca domestica TaxID=7370 RepID=A0A9J7CX43_MUSDO|nr:uncharacterized protein LOC101892051 [Musca domestica]
MSKLNVVLLFVVVVAINSASAALPSPLEVLTGTLKNMNQIRNTLFCLAHSCDPFAIQKAILIDDVSEFELKQRTIKPETKADRVMKLSSVVAEASKKLLAIDPNCKNPSYTCPTPHPISLPKEIYDFENAMGNILAYSKCTTLADFPEIISLLSDSVEYIENNRDSSGTSFQRVVPAVELVARGFKNICDRRGQTVQ